MSSLELSFDDVYQDFAPPHAAQDWGKSGGSNSSSFECDFWKEDSDRHDRQSSTMFVDLDGLQLEMDSPSRQIGLESAEKLRKSPNDFPEYQSKFDISKTGAMENLNLSGIGKNSGKMEEPREKKYGFSFSSLALLNSYDTGFRLNMDKRIETGSDTEDAGWELSTGEIMKIAGTKFIQSFSRAGDVHSMIDHPFDVSFSSLSAEEIKDVELAEILLASAEKVGAQQYERASNLLKQCNYLSSNLGSPVQRVVYYFSEALRERIDRETGRITKESLGNHRSFNINDAMMSPNSTVLAYQEKIPFAQTGQFAGIQAILEKIGSATKIHVIDLAIRNGIQWTILMQALSSHSESPVELLKVTAIGTNLEHLIEDTGRRLESFAQTMNLPFCFKTIMVSDILDLRKDQFDLDSEETVAIYAEYFLRSMIPKPDRLESLMRVIRSIKPSLMVIAEVEANHNSPFFVKRVVEALFFFSAHFDCLETFTKRDDPNRIIAESLFFGEGIRNMVAKEADERTNRNVTMDVWRAFFSGFGMAEMELSSSSLYQARLVVQRFGCSSSCTLSMNGQSLIIGWKGTPMHSLSAWKFVR